MDTFQQLALLCETTRAILFTSYPSTWITGVPAPPSTQNSIPQSQTSQDKGDFHPFQAACGRAE
jgi:hypothetical protein